MKVIMEFDLNDDQDREDHQLALKAQSYSYIIHNLEKMFRDVRKYKASEHVKDISDEQVDFLGKLEKEYYQMKQEILSDD